MKTRDVLQITQLALVGYGVYKVGTFLGFIKTRDEKKSEQNTADALTGGGKMGKAFDFNYVNELNQQGKLSSSDAATIQNNLQELINKIYMAYGQFWGGLDDNEQGVLNAYSQINSIAQASLVNRGIAEKSNTERGTNYTNGLEYLQEFLNAEEIQLYVYDPLQKKDYLP